MEALKLLTVDDLIQAEEERVELIDGEIVRRPVARFEHGLAQSALSDEVQVFKRRSGPGGWWIVSEISVLYSEHQCPSHDLAGWRKERVPERPSGIMTLAPDWVCEILSPGHERKDMLHHLLLLQRSAVPYYWILSPEDRTLIVYALDDGTYRLCYSVAYRPPETPAQARIPPFESIDIDLGYIFGETQ
ncbi:MAG TPA: Uma2 family endonuclease [Chromatiaceae bacterium]|nr:Uma2 family endonuclease [Chromatiaceae bacterium]